MYGSAATGVSGNGGSGGKGVYGFASGSGYGVYGFGGTYGVYGAGQTYGVYGNGGSNYGVYGISTGNGQGAGVYGTSDIGFGVEGVGTNGADGGLFGSTGGYAGYFNGDVYVNGNLGKATGSFKIDDPLDPEHRYLSHSFVESPDMMNIYNGNVVLDSKGQAWVALPSYFQALNFDFRYQLTSIGMPQPGLYISREIRDNRFKIAGGRPHGKVSWMVTGVRCDPYAKAHPIKVEEVKPAAEQGTYLHPDVYGQPETKGAAWSRFHRHSLPFNSKQERRIVETAGQ